MTKIISSELRTLTAILLLLVGFQISFAAEGYAKFVTNNSASGFLINGAELFSSQNIQLPIPRDPSTVIKKSLCSEDYGLIKRIVDILVAIGTLILALYTIVLAQATNQLAKSAKEQGIDMKASIAVMETSAKAMQDSAFFLNQVADSSSFTASAAEESARAAYKSADLTERALTDIERPYIFVTDFAWLEANVDFVGGYESGVSFTVVNYGKTPAIILNASAVFNFKELGDDTPLRLDAAHSLIASPIFGPGEKREKLHHMLPGNMPTNYIYKDGKGFGMPELESNKEFHFWLLIDYRGPFTKEHVTSACWRWNNAEGAFVQSNDEDYSFFK